MKVAQINNYGHADVIKIANIEKPKAGKGQVLIENYASNINPVDIVIREGHMAKMAPLHFPATLGSDLAGVVVEVGEEVTNFNIGDKVYGSGIVLAGASGAFAEFVATSAMLIAKMPSNINFNEAAAVVLTGTSAVQALVEHLNLKTGQKIFIHGGAGGIGTIAIQIAKKIGAYVATTATGEGIDYVKKLRVDEVIDYKNQAFHEIISDYDAVFDTVGGETYAKSFKVLKRGGIIVSMVAPVNEDLAEQYGAKAITQFTKVTTEHLDMLTRFIEDGDVLVHIDKIFSLDKIQEAFKAKEKGDVKPVRGQGASGGIQVKQTSNGVKGKIVVEIKKL